MYLHYKYLLSVLYFVEYREGNPRSARNNDTDVQVVYTKPQKRTRGKGDKDRKTRTHHTPHPPSVPQKRFEAGITKFSFFIMSTNFLFSGSTGLMWCDRDQLFTIFFTAYYIPYDRFDIAILYY